MRGFDAQHTRIHMMCGFDDRPVWARGCSPRRVDVPILLAWTCFVWLIGGGFGQSLGIESLILQ
jgi:hypothetical protein